MLKKFNTIIHLKNTPHRQRGAVLMVMLVIIIMGSAAFLVSALSRTGLKIERDKITAEALAQAKEALISYAASININATTCDAPGNNCKRPGDLPCPDTTNDGVEESGCGNAAGSTGQSNRLGRLPWKSLGLPDLRDGSGERLWYAVSNNFKYNTRTTCTSPGQTGCLNSDTPGTISVRNADGSIQYDGSTANGVVAVIIAPGAILQRADQVTLQDRSNSGVNFPINYLDIATGVEDNADFGDSTSNGFIQGIVKDVTGKITLLNDQIIIITQDNIMQAIQIRVAGEVKQCLNEFSLQNQNHGRYPWAARVSTSSISYNDRSNQLFGRVPDTPFDSTYSDSNNNMGYTWQGNCNINSSSGWWLNWKEMVFYGLADAYKPASPVWNWWTGWSWPTLACPTCLSVNPPSATADKQFVVLVAGRKLTTIIPPQARNNTTDMGTLYNYLEGFNSNGASPFAQGQSSATFNDTVVFQQ